MNLQNRLQEATANFVSALESVLREASLSDLGRAWCRYPRSATSCCRDLPAATQAAASYKPRRGKKSRKVRATAQAIQEQKDHTLIVCAKLAKNNPEGFARGDVAKELGEDESLTRILGLLVNEGKLRKKGERRFTRYFVTGNSGGKKTFQRAAKKRTSPKKALKREASPKKTKGVSKKKKVEKNDGADRRHRNLIWGPYPNGAHQFSRPHPRPGDPTCPRTLSSATAPPAAKTS